MSQNRRNQRSETTKDLRDSKLNAQDLPTSSESNSLSSRSFLGQSGASTAVMAAAGAGLPSMLLGERADARGGVQISDRNQDTTHEDDSTRRSQYFGTTL